MLLIVMLLTATTAWADQQYLYLEVNGSSATMKFGEDFYGKPYYDERAEWWISDFDSWEYRENIVTITVDASCQNFNGDNLSGLFSNFTALQTINNTANLNTSQVQDMSSMFVNCSSFTKLDLSAWDTGEVTDMSSMFHSCGNLTKLNLSGWNTANVTNMISMFESCSSLAFIYVGTNWNTENVTNGDGMFVSCENLPNCGYPADVTKAYVGDGGYLTSNMKTIYCEMEHDWWTADNAAIGIYAWGDNNQKIAERPGERMTLADGETNIWKFNLDIAKYENFIFTRVNGSGDIADWGAKTVELTIPTDDDDMFTITSSTAVWGDPGCEGTWSKYTAPPSLYDVIVWTDGNGTAEAAPNEAVSGETVTLTVTPANGYMLSAITVNDGEVEVTGNSFVMPKSNAFVDVTFEPIYYIDANGTMHYADEATVLDGSETVLNAGWYVVNSNLTYDHALQLGSGTINIILADGKKMSIGTEDSYIHDSSGIVPTDWRTVKSDLCIYGQTAGTGSMEVFSDYGISYINSYTQHGGNVKSITYATSSAFKINYYPANDNSTCNFTLNGGTVVASAGSQGVEAKNNIIINGGTLDATARGNNVTIVALMANNNIIINGGQVTATSNGNSKGIYAEGGSTTLAGGSVTASSYEGTVIVANGWTYAADEDDITYSGTLENSDIANKTLRPKTYTTYYIDADGTRHYVEDATVLDGSNNELSAGWYVVKGNVEYSSKLSFGGDVNLILADGASLTVNSGDGDAINVLGLLTIYGQAQGTGQLQASSTNSNGIYATGDITINGGRVGVSGGDDGISAYNGNITVNGGSVEARAQNYSIFATGGNIILNGGSVEASSTNSYGIYAEGGSTILAGGSVKSNIYQGTVTVATDFTYAANEDDNTYSGTLGNSDIAAKTLRPKTYTTYYIDADGTRYDDVTATVLNGLNRELSAGWYVVKGNVNYSYWLYCTGDMHLILADDANLVVTESRMRAIGVDNGSLTIYGQAQGTGQLHASTESGDGINASKGNITINGGRVGVSGVNCGISAENGNITINGGTVVASGMNNNGINATNGTILAGGSVMANSYEGTVTIATGLTYIDNDKNTYTGTLDNEAIAVKRLSPKTNTVTFDFNYEDGEDPEMQIVLSGRTATEPTAPIRTGYTLSGWKLNEEDYDFDTPVTSDITLIAVWKVTYTVEFNANGGSGDEMKPMQLTCGDWATLPASCIYTAPDGKVFKNWNTAADGSGTPYELEEWVYNLTDEPNGTVVLYAQWGKDIATCTINVPGQTLDGTSYIFYKFESANSGNVETGTTVYDGETLLTVGTDYKFDQVYFYGTGTPCTDVTNKLGDHFTVVIKGIGDYAGTTTADFYIVSPEANGEWGDLAWAIDADGNFTITGSGAMNETTKGNYPWYEKAGYIKTITIGEGITTVAANAFCRAMEMNVYGNVHSLTLPSSLTSIGEFAFAYCTALNINMDDLEGINFPANAFSYINSLTGTLYADADNTKTVSVMAQASKNVVTLKELTLYKDGDWNTLCLPFDVSQGNSILDGATIKELDVENYYDANGEFYTKLDHENAFRTGFEAETGTLRLYFKNVEADGSGVVLQAGTPYLIKWDKAEGYDDADPATRDITGDHVFWDAKLLSLPNNVTSKDHNVTFYELYKYIYDLCYSSTSTLDPIQLTQRYPTTTEGGNYVVFTY